MRHRLLIAACTVVLGGAAILAAWLMPSYYVSEARVLVGVQSPRLSNVELIVADVSPDAERVQNEGFILQSRNIAKQVIDQLKLRQDPEFNPELAKPSLWAQLNPMQYLPPQLTAWFDRQTSSSKKVEPIKDPSNADDRTIDSLLSHIDVSTLGRSHVLSVKAESRNPQTASAIANALAERYLDYQRRDKIESMDRVDKFLMGRVAELRDQVRKSDQAVEDYRRTHDLYKSAGSTSSGGVTTQQLTELNSQLLAAQTAKAEADSRLKEAQEMRKGGLNSESVPEVLNSPLIAALKQQQADAERRAAQLQATYGAQHPQMLNARAEVGSVQAKVNAEIAKVIDGLAREARTADARYEALAKNFETLKGQMGSVNDKVIGLEALERDATVNRNLLQAVLLRAKQSTGAEDILTANAKLVSPASPAQAPSYPPKALLALLGVAGGMMVGVTIALLREGGDHTFRRADQIEALTGLPVMAMVPQVAGRGAAGHAGAAPADLGLQRGDAPPAYRHRAVGVRQFAQDHPDQLGHAVGRQVGDRRLLGRLLASNGTRVPLIHCDWRSPRLHQIFRCSNRDGLASLLIDKASDLENTIHHDALSGVDVMPSGPWSPRSAHLLSPTACAISWRRWSSTTSSSSSTRRPPW